MFIDKAVEYNHTLLKKAVFEKILPIVERNGKVLDVGGGDQPLRQATHILDIQEYPENMIFRLGMMGVDSSSPRFNKERWIVHDICEYPWPFKDNEFDYVFCSQTLEDIRDPIGACKEMMRIGKAGYISCPGKLGELMSPINTYPDADKYNGYWHHRWLVSKKDDMLIFEQKHIFAFSMNWTDDDTKRIIQEYPELGTTEMYWEDKLKSCEIVGLSPEGAKQDLVDYFKELKVRYKK